MKMPEKIRISVDLIKELKSVNDGKPRRVSDLAIKVNTTEAFLLQVVRLLGKEGLINVIRGPGGGVTAGIGNTNLLKVYQTLGYFQKTSAASSPLKASEEIENKLKDFLSNTEL